MHNKRNSNRAAIAAALIVCAGALATYVLYNRGAPQAGSAQELQERETLEILTKSGVRSFNVEVARTDEQQRLGLMFRTSLADDTGMLFPHEHPQELTMWMKNTFIPLDMVFIEADGTIHRIEENTEPLSERIIQSNGPAKAVLELTGGAAKRLGLAPGDTVRHPIFAGRGD